MQGNARKQPIGKLNRVWLKVFDIVRNALAVQFVSQLLRIGQGFAVAVQLCNGFAVVGMGGDIFEKRIQMQDKFRLPNLLGFCSVWQHVLDFLTQFSL